MGYDDKARTEVIANTTCERFIDIIDNLSYEDKTEFYVPAGKLLDVLSDILYEQTINMSTKMLTQIQMRIMELVQESPKYSRIHDIIIEESENFMEDLDENFDDIDFEEFLDGFLIDGQDDGLSRDDIDEFLDGEFDDMDGDEDDEG